MYESELNREIGARVKDLRLLHDITRENLARHLGIAPSHLGLIERGIRGLTIAKCLIVSELFNVSMDYLLAGRGESHKKKITDALGSRFTIRETQLINRLLVTYSLIPAEKRNPELIFEDILHSLEHFVKVVDGAGQG